MIEAMRHEPFYATGIWINESLGIYLGWVARKDSFADGMPLRSEQEDVVMVFSGEDFSDPRFTNHSGRDGHPSRATYLVDLYQEDPHFPVGLNGTFHGIVIDERFRTAKLFNDRYGMHRICFHESKDAFCFAAEAKAILAAFPETARPDVSALGEFVSYGCVLNNRTIFQDIEVLPCGSVWTFRDGSIEKKEAYFRPQEWEDQAPFDREAYYKQLREAFSRNLHRYFAGDEKVGMTVTGGLDTRMIMAWHQAPPGSLPCYTFAGPYREPQDVRIGRRVAEMCRQPYQIIQVGDEFLSKFPHYAERTIYLMEGRVDVYRSTDLYLSERAREIAPVKVVGTHASEIIRRAIMFKPEEPQPGLFSSAFLEYVRKAPRIYNDVRQGNPISFAVFRQSPWYMSPVFALEQTQLTVRIPYLDNQFVSTVYRTPDLHGVDDIRPRLLAEGNEALGRIRTDRGAGGSSGQLVELASQLLMEFTFKAEYAYDYGMPQWVARLDHMLAPFHFDRLFLGRHKLTHFRVWYRDDLAPYVREILLDPRTLSRPYLNRKGVESMVAGHLGGGRNYTTEIHKILTLELLHRLFFDRSQAVPAARPGVECESDARYGEVTAGKVAAGDAGRRG
jgi:asparagine synthase (glutamine-hydrolysing)